MKLRITRKKRPDNIEIEWGDWGVTLTENDCVQISSQLFPYGSVLIPKSEIPNLIRALEEVIYSKQLK